MSKSSGASHPFLISALGEANFITLKFIVIEYLVSPAILICTMLRIRFGGQSDKLISLQ